MAHQTNIEGAREIAKADAAREWHEGDRPNWSKDETIIMSRRGEMTPYNFDLPAEIYRNPDAAEAYAEAYMAKIVELADEAGE